MHTTTSRRFWLMGALMLPLAGMDGPAYKGRKDPYDVLLVRRDGSTSVYQKYA